MDVRALLRGSSTQQAEALTIFRQAIRSHEGGPRLARRLASFAGSSSDDVLRVNLERLIGAVNDGPSPLVVRDSRLRVRFFPTQVEQGTTIATARESHPRTTGAAGGRRRAPAAPVSQRRNRRRR